MRFVDTSAWYAALDKSDRSHHRATTLLGEAEPSLLTDHVLIETWRLAAHRLGWQVAETFFDSVRRGVARVEHVTDVDRETAWSIGLAFPDQELSLTDRTSFAVMERLGVNRVVAFDDDFAVYRYGPRRQRAFTLLR